MKSYGKISIIIPTFNRAHLIVDTIESILAQTYIDWECLVIDDGSSDGTEQVVENYVKRDSRFRYYKRPDDRPKGANACRNYGFELSQGDFINWFDDDDLMHKDKLSIQVTSLLKSEFNFSVCQTLVFENSIQKIIGLRSEEIYSNDVFYDYLTQNIVWMTPSALWRKSFLMTMDYLFNENLKAAQEWEFHCRVLLKNKAYDVINQPFVYIRRHQNSISYNDNRKVRVFNYFLARLFIFDLVRNQDDLNDVSVYLKNYLLKHLKSILRTRDVKEIYKIYSCLLKSKISMPLKAKIAFFSSVFCFWIFGRGEYLLNHITFK